MSEYDDCTDSFAGDDEYGPDIITVTDDDGKEYTFEEIDRIETDEGKYVALIPDYSSEDNKDAILQDDGEVMILRVNEEDDGKGGFNIFLEQIGDQDEYDRVAAIFEERLNEDADDDDDGEDDPDAGETDI